MIGNQLDTVLHPGQIGSPFFESNNNNEKLLVIYGVVDSWGRCRIVTRVRGEGRDHRGLGLRSGGEGIGLRMEAWLKEKENEHDTKIAQEEEGSKTLNKLY